MEPLFSVSCVLLAGSCSHENCLMPPRLAVVVVNYNRYQDTFRCLQSLMTHVPGPEREGQRTLILVDSGSTDRSYERLRNDFPTVTFLRAEENVGFCVANNLGMEHAFHTSGSAYALLLNNDAFVSDNVFAPLLDIAGKDPKAGIQCAKIYYAADTHRLWYAGGTVDRKRGISTHRGIGQEDCGQFDRVERTDFATGCALLISRECYEATKGFDPAWFAYYEDADLCLRARALGYETVYNPGARVWHAVSQTARIDGPLYLYFTMRNKILFVKRYGGGLSGAWRYFVYFYARQLIRMGIKHRSWQGFQAVARGLIDGLRGVTGKGWMEGKV